MNSHRVLARLGWLRLSIALVWLLFISWLSFSGFQMLTGAWTMLAAYLPLLGITLWQIVRGSSGEQVLAIHLAIETQLLTGLLYFTGGATNPFISYFLVLMMVAAYSLPLRFAIAFAIVIVVDYSALSQWYQPLMNSTTHGIGSHTLFDWHLAGMWLTFVISTLIMVIFLPTLMRDRQSQQQQIQQLREQQLKNEQLIGIATLAAGTAHEMGTPLMTLHMLLEELTHTPNEPLNPKDLKMMQAQVSTCRQSLQQLAYSGRQAQHSGLHSASAWLKLLLHRWRLSQPNALWEDLGCDTDAVIAASPLLDQALLNLLNNATEAGNLPIQLRTHVRDGFWSLDIVQPDPQAAQHIQEDALFSTMKDQGMGLGLYLSNASVEQFGGEIHLRPLRTGGSFCLLQLPVIQHEEQ